MESDDPILDDADPEQEVSDVHSDDEYSQSDYFSQFNTNYANAHPLPQLSCPKEIVNTYQPNSDMPKAATMVTFREFSEKLFPFINPMASSWVTDDLNGLNPQKVIENYQITLSNAFDYSLTKYDIFSKNHHRIKLHDEMCAIDWSKESKVIEAKKATNAYEEVYEKYFDKHLSYKLANLNYLFGRELFVFDRILNYTPIVLVGDNGGLTDYIQWYSALNGFTSKVFVLPERNNLIVTAKYRREVKTTENIKVLSEFYSKCDLDEAKGLSSALLSQIVDRIMEEVENYGVSLYIGRKVIKFNKELSQEMMNRTFMLVNMILGFEMLNKDGTFILKLYDTFSLFTVSLVYILYKHFERVTIIKPFSTRPYSASRFIVCEKLIADKPKILDYLKEFLDKYLALLQEGRDVPFVIPISEVSKEENFTSRLLEINTMITEGRINELMEIRRNMAREMIMRFDKMDIKKHCLDLWKVPVLNYDESKLVKNQPRQGSSLLKNKPKTIEETAELYRDFGKYSKATEDLVNLLGGKCDEKEEVSHKKQNAQSSPSEKHLTQKEIDEQFAKIFPKKAAKAKPKPKEEPQNLLQHKRGRHKDDERPPSSSHKKDDSTHKHHHHKEHSHKEGHIRNTEDAWKEASMNRKKMENEKVQVPDDIKAQLLQYKKNK